MASIKSKCPSKIQHADATSAGIAAAAVCRLYGLPMGHWRAYLCPECGYHHIGRKRIKRRYKYGSDPELLMWGDRRLDNANVRENLATNDSARIRYITGLAQVAKYRAVYGDTRKNQRKGRNRVYAQIAGTQRQRDFEEYGRFDPVRY